MMTIMIRRKKIKKKIDLNLEIIYIYIFLIIINQFMSIKKKSGRLFSNEDVTIEKRD